VASQMTKGLSGKQGIRQRCKRRRCGRVFMAPVKSELCPTCALKHHAAASAISAGAAIGTDPVEGYRPLQGRRMLDAPVRPRSDSTGEC
jgi:hypothetical protein